MTKKNILIIDDDTRLRNLIGKYLTENGFQTELSQDTNQARELMKNKDFDLLIVDVMMPNEDGITFTSKIRKELKTPIIILTARGDFDDRIKGLEAGADDYLAKPFEPKELLLRINNILKRSESSISLSSKNDLCNFGDFCFDLKSLKLIKGDEFIYLTESESKILKILCKNKNSVINREQISEIFGKIDDRSIDVQITRLRKKIEENPKQPEFLQTIRNKGYILR